jgi:hypothetical protein
MRHWGRFSPSISVSLANHSTDFSIIIIIRGWHNRPLSGRSVEWTQLDSTPPTIRIQIQLGDPSITTFEDLCSRLVFEGDRFESHPAHRLSWLRCFVVLISPFRQVLGCYLHYAMTNSFQFTNHPTNRSNILQILTYCYHKPQTTNTSYQMLGTW